MTKEPVAIKCKNLDLNDLFYQAACAPSGLGFTSEKGALLTALEQKQPVILQNLDQADPATFVALFQTLQFIRGETPALTIYDHYKLNGPVNFQRGDIGDFRIEATVTDKTKLPDSLEVRLHGNLRAAP